MIGLNRRWIAQLTVVMAVMCFLSAGAFAQGQGQRGNRGQGQSGGGRQMMGPQMLDRLHTAVNELNLTDEQKPKIEEIFTKAKDELQKMQPELQDLPMQERGQKVRDFTQKLNSDIKAVLTEEQKPEFDKKLAEMRAAAQGGGQGQGQGGGGGQGGQLRRLREAVESVGLTDEQKPKVDTILKDMEDKVQQARQESQGDQDAMREKGRAIATDTMAQLEQVLTPDQQQKLRETMRQNRGGGQGGRQRGDGPSTRPADANSPTTQPEKKTPDR